MWAMCVYRKSIADNWFEYDSGRQFQDHNPADECELKVVFYGFTPEDANHVVREVSEICPEWKLSSSLNRAEILFRTISPLTSTLREFALIK